jgi:glycosyltransferase involved in cell wall biosynthesis
MEEQNLIENNSQLLNLDDDDLFIKPQKKKKILFLSDHPLAPSGVGVQARFLIEGLIKTGKYTFRCLGGAMKHNDYKTVAVNEDFIIKPVDGFGTKEMIRELLITEKPDAILIFTDPRQFIWLWEMEDEIHQVCPVLYWHVWDNDPYPAFNKMFYDATDLINCLSKKTYDMVKPNFPDKTNYIPHAFPNHIHYPLPKETVDTLSQQNFGDRKDWFKVLWVNRNATRKLPGDVLSAFASFLNELEKKHGHRNAMMIMHTNPKDPEGPDLISQSEMLKLQNNVWFSADALDFDKMNVLYNLCDTCVNISKNEGFGLMTLGMLQTGKPIITLCTGGETSQVIDEEDGSENGVGIRPCKRSLVGSQLVPYIYEDYAATEDVVAAFMKMFEMTSEEREQMKQKTISFVNKNFSYDKMISDWDVSMENTIDKYKTKLTTDGSSNWTCTPVVINSAQEGNNVKENNK